MSIIYGKYPHPIHQLITLVKLSVSGELSLIQAIMYWKPPYILIFCEIKNLRKSGGGDLHLVQYIWGEQLRYLQWGDLKSLGGI